MFYILIIIFIGFFNMHMPLECKEQINLIVDTAKHEKNQKILKSIIEQELKVVNSNKADFLMQRISEIAEKLIKKGFHVDAYQIPPADENSILGFDHFVLWEGKQIPITFFVYVWPSEEHAKKYKAWNPYYGTCIHSHPIPCAFSVLEGTLYQKDFQLIDPVTRLVRLTNEEQFHKFDGAIDDLNDHFIHQLYSKGSGSKPALSLHAYGLPTKKQVMDAFNQTHNEHSYRIKNGDR